MTLSLNPEIIKSVSDELKTANSQFNTAHPGESSYRQPVHTVYGGAQIFKSNTAEKLGKAALNHLKEYAPNFAVFAKTLELVGNEDLPQNEAGISNVVDQIKSEPERSRKENSSAFFAYTVYQRILEKLKDEPVEDFRIDFEDGYGNRPDDEEDGHACSTAEEAVIGIKKKSIPPFFGIRIKPLTEELKHRSIRTLDLFLTTILTKNKGELPENFVVTLPKVTIPEQVTGLVRLFEAIEKKTGLANESLKMEIMIETPQSIIDINGNSALPGLVSAAEGRCIGAHFGVYDYTAFSNITAAYQEMGHPVCDFARHMMQVALADTGIRLSDGATNIMPVGPHFPIEDQTLTAGQIEENCNVVHHAWKVNYKDIRHSLKHGFYQGWDIHPAQLPIRYAAVYSFFLEGLDAAAIRLKSFMDKAAQATLFGDVFDDAATGQALLNHFLRGISCGAITEDEAQTTGLTMEEIRSRSFNKILQGRQT